MNELIKAGVAIGIKEMVELAMDTYVKPKLKNLNKKNSTLLEQKLNEYIIRSYNKHKYMNTIVFRNEQKTIDDLYIPLTAEKKDLKSDKLNSIKINEFPDNFMPLYKKVLLVDSAGMGKSTIVKYLYLMAIKQNKGIPMLIELRKLGPNVSIIEFIMNELSVIGENFAEKDIFDLIKGGDFIFFFDGYDEIAEESKSIVTENLQDFISKAKNNKFLMSSREENSLSCFGDFQRFDVRPLQKNEAYDLIRKYDNNGNLSMQLIDKLENEENLKIIKEFLRNPLMVSLLYKAFEYKLNVPYKKNIFYRQVYDALFEDHDRSKGSAYVHEKKSKLDVEDFYKILKALGILTLKEGISYSKDRLIELLKNAKKLTSGVDFKEFNFIYDLTHSIPLFIIEGNEYKWIHKSFQEYFAASYICMDSKEKQFEYLSYMMNNNIDKYFNVLDFCYDINYKEFRKAIIYPTIKDYTQYYNSVYVDEKFTEYDPEELDARKNLEYIYKNSYIKKVDIELIYDLKKEEENSHSNKLFNTIFSDLEKNNKEWSVYSINHTNGICIAIANNKIRTILKLLNSKQSPVIKCEKVEFNIDYEEKLYDIIPNGEYSINDDATNILNNINIFNLLNYFLKYFYADGHNGYNKKNIFLFDYKECIKCINDVDEEIKFENANTIFL